LRDLSLPPSTLNSLSLSGVAEGAMNVNVKEPAAKSSASLAIKTIGLTRS
jgi:hypothetical protein